MSVKVYADLVYESTATVGTGTLTLGGAYTSAGPAQTFSSGVGTGNTCDYCITNGLNWEVGSGTVGGSGPYTLSRDTVYASSNIVGGSPQQITLVGTSLVSNVIPASKTPYPFAYEGVWAGTSAYAQYNVVLYNGDVFISNAPIAAPSATFAISSATTSTPASSSNWSFSLSTSGVQRLVYLIVTVPNQGAGSSANNSVSSPNVTWTKVVERPQSGFGFSNYVSVWEGQAGPQLTNEAITIGFTSSYSGLVQAFDVSGLNLSGTINDPNGALPNQTGTIGTGTLTNSWTTSNANDVLLLIWSAPNTPIVETVASFTALNNANVSFGSTGIWYDQVITTQSGTSRTTAGGYQSAIGFGLAFEVAASPVNASPTSDIRWQRITSLSSMFDTIFGSSVGNVIARGSSGWQGIGPLTNGQIVIGNTGNIPSTSTLTAGTNITISNAGGSITVSGAAAAVSGLWGPTMSATPTISSMGLTTWFNQGGATANNHAAGVSIIVPASSGTNVRGMYFPAPVSTPYSYKALIALTSGTGSYAYTMLGWYNGTSTLSVFALLSNGGLGNNLEMDNWTATGFSGSNVGQFAVGCNPIWARIRDDGTNVHFAYSMTGDDNEFLDVYSVAKSSGTLGSSGYSNIFFGGNSQNSVQVIATCMSFALGT